MTKGVRMMIEIYYKKIEDVWYGVACSKHQIVASSFSATQQSTLQYILGSIPFNSPFEVFNEPSVFAKEVLQLIHSIYAGQEVNSSFHLDLSYLPIYSQKTLNATAKIPLGYVTSYGSIAKAVGGGPRAVGNVMASNPFAPIIPCHRIVKSDFTPGGYGGGLKLKLELLSRERRGFSKSRELKVDGSVLQVFPVEYLLRNFS
jgi:methylated-DNA-[protein]-cysteine S-methyltransferase